MGKPIISAEFAGQRLVTVGNQLHYSHDALLAFLFWLFVGVVANASQPAVPVIVSDVSAMAFEDRVEALGTLRAHASIQITASVTETVSALYFDDGERVEGGQLLVEMTNAEEQARLKEA